MPISLLHGKTLPTLKWSSASVFVTSVWEFDVEAFDVFIIDVFADEQMGV